MSRNRDYVPSDDDPPPPIEEMLDLMCSTPNCPNLAENGYIICPACHYPQAERAPSHWVKEKRRYERQRRKAKNLEQA